MQLTVKRHIRPPLVDPSTLAPGDRFFFDNDDVVVRIRTRAYLGAPGSCVAPDTWCIDTLHATSKVYLESSRGQGAYRQEIAKLPTGALFTFAAYPGDVIMALDERSTHPGRVHTRMCALLTSERAGTILRLAIDLLVDEVVLA